MRLFTGSSGYSYKEWKGSFYPSDLPDAAMLRFYAERLNAVEINNTFYRMPTSSVMSGWAQQVPDDFVFVIKAPQRITHRARLRDAGEMVTHLWNTIGELGAHLGPILFQLPPYFRKDLPLLRDFLAGLPAGMRPVFEFRHASWSDAKVADALRGRNAALCVADTDDGADDPPVVPTADFGYLRLRRAAYDEAHLQRWAEIVRAQAWGEAFVFFKHEDEGLAPELARRFEAAFAAAGR
jgi:uncharacterized protein YecE (DUF72 family)